MYAYTVCIIIVDIILHNVLYQQSEGIIGHIIILNKVI